MDNRQMDRQTDGGRCNISHPRAYGTAGDNYIINIDYFGLNSQEVWVVFMVYSTSFCYSLDILLIGDKILIRKFIFENIHFSLWCNQYKCEASHSQHTPMCAKCQILDITSPNHTGVSSIIMDARNVSQMRESHRAKGFTVFLARAWTIRHMVLAGACWPHDAVYLWY